MSQPFSLGSDRPQSVEPLLSVGSGVCTTYTSIQSAGVCSQAGPRRKSHGQAGRTPSVSTDLSPPGSMEEEIRPVLSRVLWKGLEAPSRPEICHSLHLGVRGRLSQRSTGKGLQQGHWPSGLLPCPPDTWLHSSHTPCPRLCPDGVLAGPAVADGILRKPSQATERTRGLGGSA